RKTAETRREEDEEQRPGDPGQAGAGGRVAEGALLKDRQVIEGDVERSVDEERGDVGDGEVARLEENQRNQRMRRARHPQRQHRGEHDANTKGDEAEGVTPVALLTVDHPEGEPTDRTRNDDRTDPVERAGRLLVAALWNVLVGGPERDQDERHVDQEGGAPGDRVHEKATHDRAKDGGRPRGAGPDAKGAPLRLAFEVGGDQRQRSGDQQGAGGALEDPKEHQQLHVWSEPTEYGGRAEPDQ